MNKVRREKENDENEKPIEIGNYEEDEDKYSGINNDDDENEYKLSMSFLTNE